MGEAVTMKMDSFDQSQGTGSLLLTGSSMSPMKCRRDFAKSDQMITVSDFQHCLPSHVKANAMRYCSDQDHIVLDAAVGPMMVEMLLKPSACPSVLLEEPASLLEEEVATRNDILDHSAWVWDSDACTGKSDPDSHADYCYTGSKMGEVVTIKVNSFDNISAAGSVLVTGSGLKAIKCERGFSKVEQLITVPQLTECLPSTVKPSSMKFCSDQKQVLLDATVGIMPVRMVLIQAPCPAVFLEQGAQASSQWPWASTTCTGTHDPPVHGPTCYSGTKMGELVTIKVHSFDSPTSAGSVLVTASGLAKVRCERPFLKAQQMISVTKLDECLPATVRPSGLKYCSDQDKVILDAHVTSIPVEMVLSPTPCPAVFLEHSTSHSPMAQTEVLGSGATRMIRTE
jgi:hypothetical protein